MGCQFAICVPDKDIILVYNADNQGKDYAKKIIIDNFFKLIVRTAVDEELPENYVAEEELIDYSSQLKLLSAYGEKNSATVDKINNRTYRLEENTMGITKIRFEFSGNSGVLYYSNAQGDKEISFGMCENVFTTFPQDGYADEIGTVPGNRRYKCAVSAAWVEEAHLAVKLQVIDTYFGVLDMHFSFRDNLVGVQMIKTAEDFLNEYHGFANGELI